MTLTPSLDRVENPWLVRIMSQNGSNNRMELSTQKPIVTKLKLPKGKNQDIPDYILAIESDFKNAAF